MGPTNKNNGEEKIPWLISRGKKDSDEKDGKAEVSKDEEGIDFKHLNENYESHINSILPDYLHRGDITNVTRYLGYHDAMMATCGTFLVLPLRNLNDMVTEEDLKKGHVPHAESIHTDTLAEYLDHMRGELIMFFLGFLIMCTIWESNNVRTIVLKRMDDFLVLLGILQMFFIIMLPFSISLKGHFPEEHVSILMTTVILIIIEVFDLVIIVYGFSSPRLLHYAMRNWSTKQRRRFMMVLCIRPIFDIALVGVAGAFTLLDYRISWVLFTLLVLWPLIRKFALFVRRRLAGETEQEKSRFYFFFTKGNISKERVEAFTDAAVAIIACVLILDITVEAFPTPEAVEKNGLLAVLVHMKLEFVCFFGTYIAVSLLWYVNHTILHLFHTVDVVVLYLQKIFLAFLCMSPLSNAMLAKFAMHGGPDAQVALLFSCLTFFAASITQFLMLMWGYRKSEKLLHQWATVASGKTKRKRFHYVNLKSITIPLWSLVGVFSSFGSDNIPGIMEIVCLAGCFVTFIALKIIFLNHVGKDGISRFEKNSSPRRALSPDEKKELEKEIWDGDLVENEEELEREMVVDAESKDEIEQEISDGKFVENEEELESSRM